MSMTRQHNPDRKTRISLRFIIRNSEDGLVAECLDAGAIGIGDTKRAAIQDMIESLEVLFQEHGEAMKVPATEADESTYRLLQRRQPDPALADIVAWGCTERVFTTGSERRETFDVSELCAAA
jgi:hypothetical protein